MKKIFLFPISVLMMISLCGSVSAEMQQEPDAVYHQIVKEYTINEDGSYDLHYFKELELKSHFAFNQLYGETFVVYNPDYQELKINEAYTIMADGKKTPSPENAFNEVLPRQAADFPDYSHLNEMVITHTGLEVGATIYLDYTLKTSADMFDGFSFKEMLRKRVPVQNMKVIVHTPEDYELDYRVNNLRTGPEIEETERGKTYTWKFNEMEPLPREGNMCESKKEWLAVQSRNGFRSQLDLASMQSPLPSELAKKAEELSEKAKNQSENVNEIYSYLANNIDASALQQKYIGKNVRTSEKVWQSNIATVLERAVLLSSMLKKVGISAMPALLLDEGALPVMEDNRQVLVKVDLKKDEPLLLSLSGSSAKNLFYKHAGKELIPLEEEKTEQRIKIEPKKNAYKLSATFSLSLDTMTGNGEIMLMHAMNPYLQIQEDKNRLKKIVSNLRPEKVSINQLSTSKTEAEFEYGTQLEQVAGEQFGYFDLTLPNVDGSVVGDDFTLWSERITPFEIPFPMHGELEFTFDLDGIECINESFEQNQDSDVGEVSVYLEVKPETVTVKKTFSLNKKCYNPLEYNEVRSILRVYNSKDVNKLIFKEKE
ncbi:MAG: DUF3857 domain-containing protein [Bacteroidota bacterium]